jgi:molecular chaperone Hsp33
VTRFLFEDADIRGLTVHLDDTYRDILSIHQYPPGVGRMLGQFMAAAVLMRTNLKFEGKLILQSRSQGQIPLLMVECDHSLNLRAIARGAGEATAQQFGPLLGEGQLAITVDPVGGRRYQGIVPLSGESLAHCLDNYFAQSEQLGTRLWLAADTARAAGLLLQQLPRRIAEDESEQAGHWRHVSTLTATLTERELLALPPEPLLHRLYHQEAVRLFAPVPVRFRCSCSRQRTLEALAALDPAEIAELLEELGSITMDCEFCNQRYHFTREDLAQHRSAGEPKTLH